MTECCVKHSASEFTAGYALADVFTTPSYIKVDDKTFPVVKETVDLGTATSHDGAWPNESCMHYNYS